MQSRLFCFDWSILKQTITLVVRLPSACFLRSIFYLFLILRGLAPRLTLIGLSIPLDLLLPRILIFFVFYVDFYNKFFALDRLTFILRTSPTNPIVFLLFSSIPLLFWQNLERTALKMITSFSRPWKESIVFTSHFLFFPPIIDWIKETCWL